LGASQGNIKIVPVTRYQQKPGRGCGRTKGAKSHELAAVKKEYSYDVIRLHKEAACAGSRGVRIGVEKGRKGIKHFYG